MLNKKQIETTYTNIKAFLEKLLEDTMSWLKKHKKLLAIGVGFYLLLSFIFGEEKDEYEDED